jgi:hypothetical protein
MLQADKMGVKIAEHLLAHVAPSELFKITLSM